MNEQRKKERKKEKDCLIDMNEQRKKESKKERKRKTV